MPNSIGMKGYMKGALLLTISSIIVKVMSAIYRVPYQNLVGDAGFYIYQQVYPFISFFVAWTSGGFAAAISKMLADAELSPDASRKKSAISQTVFLYLAGLSLFFFSLLFFGANLLASWMGDEELSPLLRTGSFVTLFMPFLALMKGAFQSRGEMAPVAKAQVFEQFIRVTIILAGAFFVMATSRSLYAAGHMAVLGTVVGEVAGIVCLFYFAKKRFSPFSFEWAWTREKKWPIIKEVTLLSISISMSSLLLLCFQLIDSFTVYSLMVESGMNSQLAKETKGIYDRGQSLVQLGLVIASSLSVAVVPIVAVQSKKQAGRGTKPFMQLTYRAALIFGVAASLGLVIVMPYVNEMLFETNSLQNVLSIYVLQIIPLSIILTFTAILQGLGKLKVPFFILSGAILLKGIGNLILVPFWNVQGSALSSSTVLLIAAILLIAYLKKLTQLQLAPLHFYIKLAGASLAMTLAVQLSDECFERFSGIMANNRMEAAVFGFVLIAIGAFVFLTFVAKLRMLSEKEWFFIPFGRRMAAYQLWLNKRK
ncbi:putative polysaccharide biosynthesis protein [Ureibacillus thermophilus]|uniref:Polysaccharide biosynthesis protein n=1 Tax=Ureibacillus thermophilus TaxID=367743 RepID=A0A4P6UTA5_9BACL|nr:polysaccharide biosynthesis protein [Ureibacillus thermophilus]QBK24752.1 polysaccharide biosynthesis protein [Ureibacillus thermophilus]